MSIKYVSPSFEEQVDLDNLTITVTARMTWEDYYNGFGDLVNQDGEIQVSNYSLPFLGDNYSIYFNTVYNKSAVLTNINTEGTEGRDVVFDNTFQDLDKTVIVDYTWSDNGASDAKRLNEASSWKIRYETTLNEVSVDTYIAAIGEDTGKKIIWAEKYLDQLDPTISIELPGGYTGAYSGGSANDKKEYRDAIANEIPELIKRTPRITVTLTAYGSEIKAFTYAKSVGKVNSTNFLGRVYSQKELALLEKNKLPSYDANEWLNVTDEGHWLFIDWAMDDLGNGFFQYDLTFEFEDLQRPTPDGEWNRFFETDIVGFIELDMYDKIDFYDVLLSGMDFAIPNDRNGK